MQSNQPTLSARPCRWRRVLPALVLLGAAAAHSQTTVSRGKIAIDPARPHLTKASSHLLRARELALAGASADEMAAAVPGLRLTDGRPEVEIRLSVPPSDLLATLAGRGLEVESSFPRYRVVYGRLDLENLAAITALPEVRIVRQMPRAGRRVGATTNQADQAMSSDQARAELPFDGSGIIVGILSDSFQKGGSNGGSVSTGTCDCSSPGSSCNTVATGMANQASGDLPPSVPILDDCTNPSFCSFLSDEGAALGENIRDIAPGAAQMFHSAFNSPLDFALGITELVNCGADVIVDDVFWTGQPFFQDGAIADAAQNAVDAGVPYFSAAGNDATYGISDAFEDVDPLNQNQLAVPDGADFHDFGGGDTFAAITVPNGCEIFTELQWSEPFENLPGFGAHSDLDLYILSSAADPASTGGANILASGTDRQGCGTIGPDPDGDPIETNVFYQNSTGSPDTVFLAVDHFCGSTSPLQFRTINISFNCPINLSAWDFEDGIDGLDAEGNPIPDLSETEIFVDSQIFGHPAAAGAFAVAAAFFGEIIGLPGSPGFPPGTIDPPAGQFDVESFSSLGGDLPFFFDAVGNTLPGAPQHRFKPEFTAPDGGNTTFFGTDIFGTGAEEPDTFPNFFGTSAAAPNAAAVAALIQDLTKDNLKPRALGQLLVQSIFFDLETPGTDDLSGSGLIDARRALRSLDEDDLLAPLIDDLAFDLDGDSFLKTPNPGSLQRLEAKSSLLLQDGDFDGLFGIADSVIFADGFESGDTAAWSSSPP